MLEALAILVAGVAAGAVNAVVGSGTLITFPVLLAAGYPPVVANVSNTVGLVPGSVAGAVGYRRELAGQAPRVARLAPASVAGSAAGAAALLVLPDRLFEAVVPAFIAMAVVLVVVQPRLGAALARARAAPGAPVRRWTLVAVFAAGVYGGYFGAAQGILLLAILGLALHDGLQRVNALKVVLALAVNAVAGLLFALAADVAWWPALLIAAGSIAGGALGARYGRRLRPAHLRGLVVAVGVAAVVQLLLG